MLAASVLPLIGIGDAAKEPSPLRLFLDELTRPTAQADDDCFGGKAVVPTDMPGAVAKMA